MKLASAVVTLALANDYVVKKNIGLEQQLKWLKNCANGIYDRADCTTRSEERPLPMFEPSQLYVEQKPPVQTPERAEREPYYPPAFNVQTYAEPEELGA